MEPNFGEPWVVNRLGSFVCLSGWLVGFVWLVASFSPSARPPRSLLSFSHISWKSCLNTLSEIQRFLNCCSLAFCLELPYWGHQQHSWCPSAGHITLTHWPFLLHCLCSVSTAQSLLGFPPTPWVAALFSAPEEAHLPVPILNHQDPWGSIWPRTSSSLPSLPEGLHFSSSVPPTLTASMLRIPRAPPASEWHLYLLYRQFTWMFLSRLNPNVPSWTHQLPPSCDLCLNKWCHDPCIAEARSPGSSDPLSSHLLPTPSRKGLLLLPVPVPWTHLTFFIPLAVLLYSLLVLNGLLFPSILHIAIRLGFFIEMQILSP